MKKAEAIKYLGGTVVKAAKAVGISSQAISQWPDELSSVTADRVFAAFVRMHPSDWRERWPRMAQQLASDMVEPEAQQQGAT